MGTKGLYGFRAKDKTFLFYNSCDSYFSGLGAEIIAYALALWQNPEWREALTELASLGSPLFPAPLKHMHRCTADDEDQDEVDACTVLSSADEFEEETFSNPFCEFAYVVDVDSDALRVITYRYDGDDLGPKTEVSMSADEMTKIGDVDSIVSHISKAFGHNEVW